MDQRPRAVLSVGDSSRNHHGLRVSDSGRDGLRLCNQRVFSRTAADRTALGVGGLRTRPCRGGHGDHTGGARPRFRSLHLLSASDWQRVLLHRRRACSGRVVDLGRADVDQSARLEESQSGPSGAAADVRQCRGLLSLGLDGGWRGARTSVADHSRRARPAPRRSTPGWRVCSSLGRCTPSSISG